MILESILVVTFALIIDYFFGDPKNRYHPTAWIGRLVAWMVPAARSNSQGFERVGSILFTITVTSIVTGLILLVVIGLKNFDNTFSTISLESLVYLLVLVGVSAVLLKTTIAIKGMKQHALAVSRSLEKGDLDEARTRLSLIVKRNTKNLDREHILSGVLESLSENIVDGITGPLFYFAFFGLPGAFAYRTINTIDSMVGYKNSLFQNVGWFGANCDKILNYLPARITAFVMVFAAMIQGYDWKGCYQIIKRDSHNTQSPNAGYPMAALAGALGTKFEKINHYTLGNGTQQISKEQIHFAIKLMQITSVLFCIIFTIPVILVLGYFGWWIHA